jgi:hypothetical protein
MKAAIRSCSYPVSSPATRNMTIIREIKSAQELRAIPTTSISTNNTTCETTTTEAQLPPSSCSAPPDGVHGKDVNTHACSVTNGATTPMCCQQHTRSLWASLCAGLGPDLHSYTKEQLEMETPNDEIRLNIADIRIASPTLLLGCCICCI